MTLLLDASLHAIVLAAMVAIILRATGVQAQRVRHGAWTSVLCAMLLMRVLPRLVPSDFLKASATLRTSERARLLEDARAGVMPLSFQYMMARDQ